MTQLGTLEKTADTYTMEIRMKMKNGETKIREGEGKRGEKGGTRGGKGRADNGIE